jgi:DNA-binding CsgD family transcriptional regulator
MEISPAQGRLGSLAGLDAFESDDSFDAKLSELLRNRQRPLLMLITPDGELLYSTIDGSGTRRGELGLTQRLINEALGEAGRSSRDEQPAPGGPPSTAGKPGERSVVVTVGTEVFCMRLFPLREAQGASGELYAVLVEPISRPQPADMDVNRLKNLFRLSKREIDVLGALMSGDTDKEIAQKLTVSVETVRAYLKSIRAKLRVKTRTAIVSIVHGVQREQPAPID